MPSTKQRKDIPLETSGKRLPLHALLSAALVAFTIEFDNEFEHQMPHLNRRCLKGSSRAAVDGDPRFAAQDAAAIGW